MMVVIRGVLAAGDSGPLSLGGGADTAPPFSRRGGADSAPPFSMGGGADPALPFSMGGRADAGPPWLSVLGAIALLPGVVLTAKKTGGCTRVCFSVMACIAVGEEQWRGGEAKHSHAPHLHP